MHTTRRNRQRQRGKTTPRPRTVYLEQRGAWCGHRWLLPRQCSLQDTPFFDSECHRLCDLHVAATSCSSVQCPSAATVAVYASVSIFFWCFFFVSPQSRCSSPNARSAARYVPGCRDVTARSVAAFSGDARVRAGDCGAADRAVGAAGGGEPLRHVQGLRRDVPHDAGEPPHYVGVPRDDDHVGCVFFQMF